jgi:iron complex transport system permease protein
LNRKKGNLRIWILILLLFLTAITFIAGIIVGPVKIPISDTLSYLIGRKTAGNEPDSVTWLIITRIRLPRVLMGLLVGCSLAVAGATMQGLFRNPLASPYVLGIASGASTGASLIVMLGLGNAFFLPVGAFVGGLVAAGTVYILAQGRSKKTSVYTLILAGVAVGALFSAVTSFVIFLSAGSEKATDIVFWIMGGLGRASWSYVYILAPIVIVGVTSLIALSRDLNALSLGEENAFHLGIDPELSKRVMLIMATLLTSAAAAFAGTIGFVGLIIPHIMRLIVGPDHRFLLPLSAIAGAVFLVWADMAARTALSPAEMPVGIITAFFGAPFFLYLLRRKGGNMS